MKFIEVTELPETNHNKLGRRGITKNELDQFMTMRIKMAKIVLHDGYMNVVSGYSALSHLVKYHALPIDIKMRNGDIYLIRRDI